MDRFVEIVDENAVRDVNIVGTPELNNFATTREEWAEQNFCPKNGVVGQVMGEAQAREGLLYLVQVSDSIMIAIRPNGIRDISFSEANRRYPLNMVIGYASKEEARQKGIESAMDEFERTLQSFM